MSRRGNFLLMPQASNEFETSSLHRKIDTVLASLSGSVICTYFCMGSGSLLMPYFSR